MSIVLLMPACTLIAPTKTLPYCDGDYKELSCQAVAKKLCRLLPKAYTYRLLVCALLPPKSEVCGRGALQAGRG